MVAIPRLDGVSRAPIYKESRSRKLRVTSGNQAKTMPGGTMVTSFRQSVPGTLDTMTYNVRTVAGWAALEDYGTH
ncbi:MAG: hypothetical protein WBW31_13985 [Candidatus Sulfotelmatobacter sp.]